MDLTRLVVRIVFVWIFTLTLVRVSGKRMVKQADVGSFVVALILGDMIDDVFWSEVAAAEFVVAAGTLVLVHLLLSLDAFRRGERTWRRPVHESKAA
jgi:uncharacterized membrane protein YcaP (DUF421 family)